MATHIQARLKVEDGYHLESSGIWEEQRKRKMVLLKEREHSPFPFYYTSQLLSHFRHNLCFTPLEAHVPTWRMSPLCCQLQPCTWRSWRSSPPCKHPSGTLILPYGVRREDGTVLWLPRSCKGSEPHAMVNRQTRRLSADVETARRDFPVQGCSWYRGALASCPHHASCRAQLGLLRPGAPARTGTGGRAQQRGPKSSRERAEKWTAPLPQHCSSSLTAPAPGSHRDLPPPPWPQEPAGCTKEHQARGRSTSFSRRIKKWRPCQPIPKSSFCLILAPEVCRPSEGAQEGPEG